MDIFEGQIVIMIHSGSRGLGHQICSDYIRVMQSATGNTNPASLTDSLPVPRSGSKEGQDYYSAMACAANFAMSNRQCLGHWVRSAFEKILNHPR
jgi:tRNA-splicing ligase RtcB (3'-phosphate/5'-hydroxy nucleic acid ligase)